MDDEDFDFDAIEVQPARRFCKADLFVVPFHLLSGVAKAITETFEVCHDLAAMHANFVLYQNDFREQAALEIEQLTSGEQDG